MPSNPHLIKKVRRREKKLENVEYLNIETQPVLSSNCLMHL